VREIKNALGADLRPVGAPAARPPLPEVGIHQTIEGLRLVVPHGNRIPGRGTRPQSSAQMIGYRPGRVG